MRIRNPANGTDPPMLGAATDASLRVAPDVAFFAHSAAGIPCKHARRVGVNGRFAATKPGSYLPSQHAFFSKKCELVLVFISPSLVSVVSMFRTPRSRMAPVEANRALFGREVVQTLHRFSLGRERSAGPCWPTSRVRVSRRPNVIGPFHPPSCNFGTPHSPASRLALSV